MHLKGQTKTSGGKWKEAQMLVCGAENQSIVPHELPSRHIKFLQTARRAPSRDLNADQNGIHHTIGWEGFLTIVWIRPTFRLQGSEGQVRQADDAHEASDEEADV